MATKSASNARLDVVFRALSDTTRRSILRQVAGREKSIGDIAEPYRMSFAAVSKHIKVLETAGLVVREKRGSFQYVRICRKPIKEAQDWLAAYEQFWDDRLEKLTMHIKSDRKQ